MSVSDETKQTVSRAIAIQPGDDREHVADSGFGRLITMET